jgi:hypothetical protein
MYPEDRVLVAVLTRPKDLKIARARGWYRVPETNATPGIFSEYVAFYFTAAFAQYRWAMHYYARWLGHELAARREPLPDEPKHPRVAEPYHKLQLGPLQKREPPIVSLRWRRITFIHTTWDRFEAASEINDLFAEGDEFVDRLYHTLRETGMVPERHYPLREGDVEYEATLALPCQDGILAIEVAGTPDVPAGCLDLSRERLATDSNACLQAIRTEVERLGGMRPLPASHPRP